MSSKKRPAQSRTTAKSGGTAKPRTAAMRPATTGSAPVGDDTAGWRARATDLFAALNEERADAVALHRAMSELSDAIKVHQKRVEELARQVSDVGGRLEGIVDRLLPVVDRMDLLASTDSDVNLASYQESVRKAARHLVRSLELSGVEFIGEEGQPADPDTHEIVDTEVADGHEDDIVLRVERRGVRYEGKLLRPARVITAVKGESALVPGIAASPEQGSAAVSGDQGTESGAGPDAPAESATEPDGGSGITPDSAPSSAPDTEES